MEQERDPTAIQIGRRIRQAREQGGYPLQSDLNTALEEYGWSRGRLGNYETGFSTPNPDDVQLIAKLTRTSPCWIMFGIGPVSPVHTIQAIRHQNLVQLVRKARRAGELTELHMDMRLKPGTLQNYVDDPFLKIHTRMARALERATFAKKGWMDEQHIEFDPLYSQLPEDVRTLLAHYSAMSPQERRLLLRLAKAIPDGVPTATGD